MFRGGPVNSRGTGITSGLGDSGYADGGRVALGFGGFLKNLFSRSTVPTTVTSANAPLSGYALKSNVGVGTPEFIPNMSYSDVIGVGDFAKAARPYLANPAIGIPALGYGAYEIGRLPGRLTDSGYEIEGGEEEKFIKDYGYEILGKETSTGEAITGYYLTKNQKRAQDLLKRGEPGDKEMAEKLIKSSTPQKNEEQPKESELDKLKKFYEDQISSERKKYEDQLTGLKTTSSTEEEDIIKQTQLYQKLLGGDEAKSQAVYDALLAASPAFFKGRNLREAAPEVLTAINKSGAFDKPRDIRQAAAQLSIQRAMLKDKAIAEERARLGQIQLAGEGKKDSVAAQLKELTGSGAIIGNITPDKLQQAVKDYPVGSNLRVVDPTTKRTSFIRIVSQKNAKGETIKSFEEYLI
jgi:hypothetical protein